MADQFKGGFGSKRDQIPSASSRSILSYKEMNMEEHFVLTLMHPMLLSDQYNYSNTYNKDGSIKVYGEEKYAVDAVILARKMMSAIARR